MAVCAREGCDNPVSPVPNRKNRWRKFCSAQCRHRHYNDRRNATLKAKRGTRTCKICGGPLDSQMKRYCSACKVKLSEEPTAPPGHCLRCQKPLPPGHRKVCDDPACRAAQHYAQNIRGQLARQKVRGDEGGAGHTTLRTCLMCGRAFASEGRYNRRCGDCEARLTHNDNIQTYSYDNTHYVLTAIYHGYYGE